MNIDPPPTVKTYVTVKRKVLKNGTVKLYRCNSKYKVKGHVNPDGTVTRFSDEQKEEMRRLRKTGVTKTRLAKDFGTTIPTINKIVDAAADDKNDE